DEMVYLYTDLSNEEMLRNTAYEDGKSKGRLEGKAEGKLEGKIEDVKNALALNLDIETITKITGLSKEEIKKIQASKQTNQ
ncbi:MAG: transposase, partial [bacterium]|nr:transposase [bacterium]